MSLSTVFAKRGPGDSTAVGGLAGGSLEVGLLTGGQDRHYAYGLATALVADGVSVDLVGGDEVDTPEFHSLPNLRFLNLRGTRREDVGLVDKVVRVLAYYLRLIGYAWQAKPKVFHILWNNKFESFDRTLLMLLYRAAGRKIAFTAHNVNAGRRDGTDSFFNRWTLWTQYRLADGIFVHTEKMKTELHDEFGVPASKIIVIPYGINNAVPETDLTPAAAKVRLGILDGERSILFFGAIAPYKGLDLLITAFEKLLARNSGYRLIIAGKPRGEGSAVHMEEIQAAIGRLSNPQSVIQKIQYIADEEIELYLKAGDVIALPYREIFQSGIFFLAASFGLPVIAADVGSFNEDVVEGETGFLYDPQKPGDLVSAIERYFESDLFRHLGERRPEIREHAFAKHSWAAVAPLTRGLYERIGAAQ
jgi:D-inositol-3-phosphate glycosyltransferase